MRSWKLLLALFALLAITASRVYAQEEDEADEGEDVEEIDTEVETGDMGGQVPPQQQMSPEEMQERQRVYDQMIKYVMDTIPEACKGELTELLNTPPQQQTEESLSPECRGPIQSAAQDFQKARAAAAQQGEQAGAAAAGGAKESKEEEESTMKTIVTVLVATLTPLAALIGYAYVSASRKEAEMAELKRSNPEAWARLQEEEEKKKKRAEKKELKARRQGKAPAQEEAE